MPELPTQQAMGKVVQVRGYLLPARDTLLFVLETGTAESEAAKKAMNTLKVPMGLSQEAEMFGNSRDYQRGVHLFELTKSILSIGLICAAAVYAWRRVRSTGKPSHGPPPS